MCKGVAGNALGGLRATRKGVCGQCVRGLRVLAGTSLDLLALRGTGWQSDGPAGSLLGRLAVR